MREFNRIAIICDIIYEVWREKCPDWRFMQLMSNFMAWLGYDPFYLEDEQFIQKFKKFANTI